MRKQIAAANWKMNLTYQQGGKFQPMYERSPSGDATILHIDRLNDFEKVKLPVITPVESL